MSATPQAEGAWLSRESWLLSQYHSDNFEITTDSAFVIYVVHFMYMHFHIVILFYHCWVSYRNGSIGICIMQLNDFYVAFRWIDKKSPVFIYISICLQAIHQTPYVSAVYQRLLFIFWKTFLKIFISIAIKWSFRVRLQEAFFLRNDAAKSALSFGNSRTLIQLFSFGCETDIGTFDLVLYAT